MSQNKTRFPGMEGSARVTSPSGGNVYSRDSFEPQEENKRKKGGSKATRIPGVENEPQTIKKAQSNSKPVRGFLFSISRGIVGEYWPLHQGKNVIGSSAKCDIRLSEATVSEEHASLTIRILENQGKTIASLKDTDSTNGTKINGEDVDFDANKCKNGDIIRFGSSYECVLILIDTKEMGLKTADNFMPIDDEEDGPDFFGGNEESSAPIFYKQQESNNNNAGGTVGLDGGSGFNNPSNSTVFME